MSGLRPIIAIDIDDTQFKSFYDLFNKYRDKLSSLPEEWKSANDVMNAGLAAIAEQTHAINHNLSTAITAQHQFAKATHVSNKGMKEMAKYAKETYDHIFKMGKFVLKAGAWGGGLLAGATFGLDKLGNAVLSPSFAGRGVNTDSGLYRAFQMDFARLAPSGMVSATYAAQQDPSKYPFMAAAAGISINAAQRMNPVALDQQLMLAAHDYYQRNRNNPNALMPEMPEMQGFAAAGLSVEDVTRLGNTTRQELKLRQEMTAADATSLRYSQKTQDAMWQFQRALQMAGGKIVTALATDLTPIVKKLGPTFDALGSDVKLLLNEALSPKNVKAVADALGDFTKYLASGQAKQDIKDFVSGVETMASVIIAAAKKIEQWMGITPPGTKAPGGPSGPRENFSFNTDRQAQMEAVRRAYGGNTFLADLKSWQTVSDQIGVSPFVGKVRGMAESKYGLLPGTLAADAQAESGNYLFAVNGNMAGWYQMSPAARKDYGVANPYDPLSSSVGEAAQLASNLALARKLDPLGTMLQHVEMQKAANILGNGGFTAFWKKEKAKGRTSRRDWMHDMPAEDRADINRYITALPRGVFSRLLAEDRAGQIDTGGSRTLNKIASTLLRIEKNTGRTQPPQRDRSTPVYRSVPLATNAAR